MTAVDFLFLIRVLLILTQVCTVAFVVMTIVYIVLLLKEKMEKK